MLQAISCRVVTEQAKATRYCDRSSQAWVHLCQTIFMFLEESCALCLWNGSVQMYFRGFVRLIFKQSLRVSRRWPFSFAHFRLPSDKLESFDIFNQMFCHFHDFHTDSLAESTRSWDWHVRSCAPSLPQLERVPGVAGHAFGKQTKGRGHCMQKEHRFFLSCRLLSFFFFLTRFIYAWVQARSTLTKSLEKTTRITTGVYSGDTGQALEQNSIS